MVSMNANELLNVMRQMAQESQGVQIPEQSAGNQFATQLNQAISSVSESENISNELAAKFEMNDPSVGLAEVMVSMQKSQLQFQALSQVRNKFVAAYQDIMNMPL